MRVIANASAFQTPHGGGRRVVKGSGVNRQGATRDAVSEHPLAHGKLGFGLLQIAVYG